MAPEDLLLAARDIMRERGLARFTFEDDDGSVCLAGAIKVASSGHAYGTHCHKALGALGAVCSERYATGVSDANDSCIVTLDEACDVLEAAAKHVAKREVSADD